MKSTYSKPILHEHSNKKRPPSAVCDEMCFHGRSRKTIISLQHLVRSVVSKLGALNFRDFRRNLENISVKDINVKQKQKKTRSHLVEKIFVSHSRKIAAKKRWLRGLLA